MNPQYTIFIASSSELQAERDALQKEVTKWNDQYHDLGRQVSFKLIVWEDFSETVVPIGKQQEYNESIKTCNIFVLLYHTKVGKFTDWEFDTAHKCYKASGFYQPKILVYKNLQPPKGNQSVLDAESVNNFENKLTNVLKHFVGTYSHVQELLGKIKHALDGFFTNGYLKHGNHAICLTDPPPPPAYFIGREHDLGEIKQRLKHGNALMLINAEGGIGKTSLAARYWQESIYDYRHCAWLFCEAGIVDELKKLSVPLGIDLTTLNEEQQLNALKQKLLAIQDDFLLVLDNANTPEHIKEFADQFGGYRWHVLITSRCHGVLENTAEMAIGHLPAAKATELFKNYYAETGPDFEHLLNRLLMAVGYNTLLTELFAKNMNQLSKVGEGLADFLKRLEQNGLFLGEASFEVTTQHAHHTHKRGTTDDILTALYDLNALDTDQQHYMATIALLPATYYDLVFLVSLLQPLDKFVIAKALLYLSRLGWLAGEEQGYRMSPVIQHLVLKKQKAMRQQYAEPLLKNINMQLLNNGTTLNDGNYKRARPYVNVTDHIVMQLTGMAFYNLAVLCDGAGVFYQATGDGRNAMKNYKEGMRIAIELLEIKPDVLSYKELLGILHSRIGKIYQKTGDCQKALENYQAFNQLERELCEASALDYNKGLAMSHHYLGDIYQQTGDWQKALDNYEAYHQLERKLYDASPETPDYKNNLAISHQRLGNIYEQNGDWQKVLENYQAYHQLERELYEATPESLEYKNGFAISHQFLGNIYLQKGDRQKALENYEAYNQLNGELYEASPETLDYKKGFAISHQYLGSIYEKTGDWQKALENYEAFNLLASELYDASPETLDYKNAVAVSHQFLGKVYRQKGDMQKALTNYEAYNQLERELCEASPGTQQYKNNWAISHQFLGNIYLQTGDLQNALESYEAYNKLACELYEASSETLEYKNLFAVSCAMLGKLFEQQDERDLQKAKSYYLKAQALWQELHDSRPGIVKYEGNLEWVNAKLDEL